MSQLKKKYISSYPFGFQNALGKNRISVCGRQQE